MPLSKNQDVGLHLQPLVIASDAFDPGEINFSDPVAVKSALEETTPGCLFTDEAIASMCQQGLAHTLFFNCPMDENHPQVVALRDWIEPSIDDLWDEKDLETRALLIRARGVFATDQTRRDLILSVKDAGIFGELAQSLLQPPMTIRTRRPPWYRPFRPSGLRGRTPNLFDAFGVEWRASKASLEQAPTACSSNTIRNGQTLSK